MSDFRAFVAAALSGLLSKKTKPSKKDIKDAYNAAVEMWNLLIVEDERNEKAD